MGEEAHSIILHSLEVKTFFLWSIPRDIENLRAKIEKLMSTISDKVLMITML